MIAKTTTHTWKEEVETKITVSKSYLNPHPQNINKGGDEKMNRKEFSKKAGISLRQLKHFALHNIYPTIDRDVLAREIANAKSVDEIKHIINQTQYVLSKIRALKNIDERLLQDAKAAGYLTEDEVNTIFEIKRRIQ
ncbi:MAG: hypothetical protein QIT35_gp62 [Methanophagales virus PBV299]|uniref:Transcriptional regulator n=1 Tax=Methanophagales virus PBV299 TaxID=2987730 RepID=A0ABY6GLH9_9CAUD|nr:MAG: hypothetical protein QIT35_gp62 [Methanophagales virus PBV299]UYL64858.1 MAG: hypothetical protein OFDIEDLO_00062 [Methanophagales virus PBV299]